MMELFCENSSQLEVVNYFRKKATLEIFEWVLNTPPAKPFFRKKYSKWFPLTSLDLNNRVYKEK